MTRWKTNEQAYMNSEQYDSTAHSYHETENYEFFLHVLQGSFDGGWTHRQASNYTGQYPQRKNAGKLHAPNGIGTHDPSVLVVCDDRALIHLVHNYYAQNLINNKTDHSCWRPKAGIISDRSNARMWIWFQPKVFSECPHNRVQKRTWAGPIPRPRSHAEHWEQKYFRSVIRRKFERLTFRPE
jgi:hypothetical protein